jgi:hypothetical protein
MSAVNLPGSYEAFLKMFAPDAFASLVVRPARRRRAGVALVAVLATAILACCALAGAASPARHVSAVHHHHRHAVSRHYPDRDESLGEVV